MRTYPLTEVPERVRGDIKIGKIAFVGKDVFMQQEEYQYLADIGEIVGKNEDEPHMLNRGFAHKVKIVDVNKGQ